RRLVVLAVAAGAEEDRRGLLRLLHHVEAGDRDLAGRQAAARRPDRGRIRGAPGEGEDLEGTLGDARGRRLADHLRTAVNLHVSVESHRERLLNGRGTRAPGRAEPDYPGGDQPTELSPRRERPTTGLRTGRRSQTRSGDRIGDPVSRIAESRIPRSGRFVSIRNSESVSRNPFLHGRSVLLAHLRDLP